MKSAFHRLVATGRWTRTQLLSAYPARLFDASFGAAWDAVMVAQSAVRVRRALRRGCTHADAFRTLPVVIGTTPESLLELALMLEAGVADAQSRSLEGITVYASSRDLGRLQTGLFNLAQLSPLPVDVCLLRNRAEVADTAVRLRAENGRPGDDIPEAARLRVGRADRNDARETLKQLGLARQFVALDPPASPVWVDDMCRGATQALPHVTLVLVYPDGVARHTATAAADNPAVVAAPVAGHSWLRACALLSECDAFAGKPGFFAHLAETHRLPRLVLDPGGCDPQAAVDALAERLPASVGLRA